MFNHFSVPTAHAEDVIAEAPRISEVLLNVLNGLLQFLGVAAVIVFVALGIAYLFSGRNESTAENVKKWLLHAVIGLSVALGSLMIVRLLVSFLAE